MKSFHSFRLDPINHCLWQGETRAPLSPKAFDLLQYLVENPNRLVPQDEILEALWSQTYVNPEIIKKYILGIRKVLGDRREQPTFIETVPRRGYRFVAPVHDESVSPEPALQTPNRIVGRASARGQLDSCLHKAMQGQRQVLFVAGEAGAGKTALLDSFQQRSAIHCSMRIARGQCVDGFGEKEAYYPVFDALNHLIRSVRGDPVAQILASHAPTWMIQFPSLLSAKQKELLRREVLGATRERMLREICEAVESLALTKPLLLVLEDLHWADPSTLDFISALARRRGPARLMFVGTYRPEDAVGTAARLKTLKHDLLVHRLCHETVLERLTKRDVGDYLATEFGNGSLPSGLTDLVYHQCAGNPLFMVAIVEDLVRQGLVARSDGGWRLSKQLAQIELGVPQTLQQMLQLQLEQLGAAEQRIVKSASVCGERFSAWEIAAAAEIEPDEIERICEELVDRQRFIRSAGIHELPGGMVSAHYEFLHALHREFVLGALSLVNRSRLHRSVAEQLESLHTSESPELAAALAMHFEAGRAYDRAIHYLLASAQTAARRFAHRESIDLLQHGLALVSRVPPATRTALQLELFERIGDAHYAIGAMSECVAAYKKQATLAESSALVTQHTHALMCQAAPLGLIDPDSAMAVMERAVQVSEGVDDDALRTRAHFMASVWRLAYGTWRNADWEICASLNTAVHAQSAHRLTDHDEMFWVYVQCMHGDSEAARHTASLKMEETLNLMGYLGAVGARMVALLFQGQFGEVLRIIRDGRAQAETNGYDPWLFNFREAWLRTLTYDFAGAQRLCESIIGTNADVPSAQPTAIAHLASGYIALEQARYDQAVRSFEQVGDVQATPKFFIHWYWRLQAQLGLVEVLLASGRIAEARSEAVRLLEAALRTGEPTLHARAWDISARAAMATGDIAHAHECVREALTIVQRSQVPLAAWLVHATASDLAHRSADPDSALRHRSRAQECVHALASSMPADEPLRASFLSAAAVRRVLG